MARTPATKASPGQPASRPQRLTLVDDDTERGVVFLRADEIEAALEHNDANELAEETGDLLFALVNLARHVGADPESALRSTNAKFERRFAYIERALAAKGCALEDATLEEMDALWNEAKGEKAAASAPNRAKGAP